MIADPIKKRLSAIIIDRFLPNRSLIQPPTAAPITAPASAVLTIADCQIQKYNHHCCMHVSTIIVNIDYIVYALNSNQC